MQPRRRFAAVALGFVLAACTSPQPSPTPTATSSPTATGRATPAPSEAATATAEASPAATSTERPIADDPPPLALERVQSGFAAPIGIAPAGDWLLISEQRGTVVALDPASGEVALAVDLTGRILDGGERGLLGLALHPDWPGTPRAFVHYSDNDGNTVVAEFAGAQAPREPPTLDADSERVLLALAQPFANHNGGQLAFGPDGHLYLGLGDGGSGGDPLGNGQNSRALLGKILRIDVAGTDPYRIPADNPFADGADGAPEVFLTGLRNPWRFSFDRATGALWIGDVGQNAFEEIDRIDPVADAGANLGWNAMEASHCYLAGCSPDGLVLPVAEYGRDLGCSVSGGFVYRGQSIGDLYGWYLFSDYCSGLLFGVRSDATGVNAPRILLETGASVSSFGEAANGELYLADIASGVIYRIVGAG